MATEVVFAYITTENKAEAEKIGKHLVGKHLAACVNIIDGMQSFYWWEGKIDEGHEAVLIAKTKKSLFDSLVQEVKRVHSYSCPCVLAIPIQGGNPDYLKWLDENLK